MDLSVLDVMLRGIAIGAMAALALGLWRGQGAARLGGLLFSIGVIAYALNSSPALIGALGWFRYPVHFIALGGAGLFWLFIVTLFEDRPVSPLTLGPWALLTVLGLFINLIRPIATEALWVVHNLIEAVFAIHALVIIARSWRGDLVEERRRLRGPFLGAVTVFVLALSAVEIGQNLGFDFAWYELAASIALALSSLLGVGFFLQARPQLFGAVSAAAAEDNGPSPADRAALAKLDDAMGAGEAWRREGLTIGALADDVGVPEHRLRRLINDALGHRNFAAFINARRIETAKALLTDPAQAQRPISAIAFDLGFGSLGPFNRAFKEATGLTPSEWRRKGSPNSENPG